MRNYTITIIVLLFSFMVAYLVGTRVFIFGTFILNPVFLKSVESMGKQAPSVVPKVSSTKPSVYITPDGLTLSPSFLTPIPTQQTKTMFARCLGERQFTMYGTPECPNCALQKSYFGDSFKLVPYVNCNINQQKCDEKNISAYPTWEDRSGKKYKGAIPLDILAKLSGCSAPEQ